MFCQAAVAVANRSLIAAVLWMILLTVLMVTSSFLDDDEEVDLLSLARYVGPGNDGGYRTQPRCVCLADICYFPSIQGWREIWHVSHKTLHSVYNVDCECALGERCKIAYYSRGFDTSSLYQRSSEGSLEETMIDTSSWREELKNISRGSSHEGHLEEYRPIVADDSSGVHGRAISPAQVTMCVLLRTSEEMAPRDGCTYL